MHIHAAHCVLLFALFALTLCACDTAPRSSIATHRDKDAAPLIAHRAPAPSPPVELHAPALVVAPKEGVAQGVVVMLHGYNSNHLDFEDVAHLAVQKDLLAISVPAPIVEAKDRFQWERDDLEATHAYLQAHVERAMGEVKVAAHAKTWVMGFSQGGMYASLLQGRYPAHYAGALAIAPAGWASIPVSCPENTAQRGEGTLVVTGERERPDFAAKTRALIAHLRTCERLLDVTTHDGGHQFPRDWPARFGEVFKKWAAS